MEVMYVVCASLQGCNLLEQCRNNYRGRTQTTMSMDGLYVAGAWMRRSSDIELRLVSITRIL